MQTVKRLKELLSTMKDDEVIFFCLYDKTETEEHIQENYNEGDEFPLTEEQWIEIVDGMNSSESIWSDINNVWCDLMQEVYQKAITAKKEVNV